MGRDGDVVKVRRMEYRVMYDSRAWRQTRDVVLTAIAGELRGEVKGRRKLIDKIAMGDDATSASSRKAF